MDMWVNSAAARTSSVIKVAVAVLSYDFHQAIAFWLAYRAPTTVRAIIGEAAYESLEGVSPKTRIQEPEETYRQDL
jgi:hypothetical protein